MNTQEEMTCENDHIWIVPGKYLGNDITEINTEYMFCPICFGPDDYDWAPPTAEEKLVIESLKYNEYNGILMLEGLRNEWVESRANDADIEAELQEML